MRATCVEEQKKAIVRIMKSIIYITRITIPTVLRENNLCYPGYIGARTTEAGLKYYKAKTPYEKQKQEEMNDDKWIMAND